MSDRPLDLKVSAREESPCEAFQEEISAYVDGAVAPSVSAQVELHLARCTSCAEEAKRFQRLAQTLRSAATVEPSARVWERLRREVPPSASRGGRGGTRSGRRRSGALRFLLLLVYDGDLADEVRQTGSHRVAGRVGYGGTAILSSLFLCLLPLLGGDVRSLAVALATVPLAWLASTRLESDWSLRRLAVALLCGATGPLAWEVAARVSGRDLPPLAVLGAVAALAAGQASACRGLHPKVLRLFRVPAGVRSAGVVGGCLLLSVGAGGGWEAWGAVASGVAGAVAVASSRGRQKRAA